MSYAFGKSLWVYAVFTDGEIYLIYFCQKKKEKKRIKPLK